jgi:two-component system, NtrC family, response regulator HydG
MKSILIVEDETIIRAALKRLLERNNFKVTEAGAVNEALQYPLESFDLIITDLRLPGAEGTEIIPMAGDTPVIIMTSYASMRSAVDAMKVGAVDYVAKPFDHEEMINTVERVLKKFDKNILLKETIEQAGGDVSDESERKLGGMIGNCELMQTLYTKLGKVAPVDVTVLIHGESGTGKELAANGLHEQSHRNVNPIISVNCAAIPETLIESELFGHEKGAFTGATASRQGLVEAAEGGTLFLDEIGELPMEAQARLLRVLQEHEVRRVGAVHARKVDVRLVAATHRNLRQLVKEGLFREDLYYRLQVIEVTLPALRERGADILEIADYLLEKHTERLACASHSYSFSDASRKAMMAYDWPGNVRELENAVQRALILSEDKIIEPNVLGIGEFAEITVSDDHSGSSATTNSAAAEEKAAAMAEHEDDLSLDDYFVQFVREHESEMNETALAQSLGVSRKCLWERRQKYGIPRPKKSAVS